VPVSNSDIAHHSLRYWISCLFPSRKKNWVS